MSRKPYVLSHLTLADVRATRWNMAVLPFGATEPHNLHMPYGTDTFQVEELGRRACSIAWEKGGRVALLPAMQAPEDGMLESATSERRAESRLSCQIVMSPALDGIVVRTPPTQV